MPVQNRRIEDTPGWQLGVLSRLLSSLAVGLQSSDVVMSSPAISNLIWPTSPPRTLRSRRLLSNLLVGVLAFGAGMEKNGGRAGLIGSESDVA